MTSRPLLDTQETSDAFGQSRLSEKVIGGLVVTLDLVMSKCTELRLTSALGSHVPMTFTLSSYAKQPAQYTFLRKFSSEFSLVFFL